MAAFSSEHEFEPVDILFVKVTNSRLEVEVPQPHSTKAESELLLLEIVSMSGLHCDEVGLVIAVRMEIVRDTVWRSAVQ